MAQWACDKRASEPTEPVVTVWRVSHRTETYGEYSGVPGFHKGPSDVQHCGWRAWEMPTPYYDQLGCVESHEVCGFPTLEKATKWFGNDHDVAQLRRLDFVVRVYRVPSTAVRMGVEQVVFRAAVASVIAVHEPDVLEQSRSLAV